MPISDIKKLGFQDLVKGFQVPCCPKCGGILKPDVIFFGDNVPVERVARVRAMVEDCSSLLVRVIF